MSLRARLGVVLAAVVVLVAAFVVLGNGSDDSSSSPAADIVTATTTAPAPGAPAATTPAPAEATAVPAEPTIAVRDGAARGGIRKLEFTSGDQVRFTVTSDTPTEVHVHGFDKEEPVAPGKPAEFSFPADIEGAYEVELHPSETQIGVLEIEP